MRYALLFSFTFLFALASFSLTGNTPSLNSNDETILLSGDSTFIITKFSNGKTFLFRKGSQMKIKYISSTGRYSSLRGKLTKVDSQSIQLKNVQIPLNKIIFIKKYYAEKAFLSVVGVSLGIAVTIVGKNSLEQNPYGSKSQTAVNTMVLGSLTTLSFLTLAVIPKKFSNSKFSFKTQLK